MPKSNPPKLREEAKSSKKKKKAAKTKAVAPTTIIDKEKRRQVGMAALDLAIQILLVEEGGGFMSLLGKDGRVTALYSETLSIEKQKETADYILRHAALPESNKRLCPTLHATAFGPIPAPQPGKASQLFVHGACKCCFLHVSAKLDSEYMVNWAQRVMSLGSSPLSSSSSSPSS